MLRSTRNLVRETWPESFAVAWVALAVTSHLIERLLKWSVKP